MPTIEVIHATLAKIESCLLQQLNAEFDVQNQKIDLLHESIDAQVYTILKFLKHLSTRISDLDSGINERISKASNDVTASIKQATAKESDESARMQVTKFLVDYLKA